MANVFVLCTGRCGSETFARAGEHLTNYTAGHETRIRETGHQRLTYPGNHIEADNRLSWFLGGLERRYGKDAYYVHLKRDPEAVARSYNQRWNDPGSIMAAFKNGMHSAGLMKPDIDWARHYVSTVTENIEMFLNDKPRAMTINLETIHEQFPRFLEWIGAEGDLDAAKAEWSVQHNVGRRPSFASRARGKLGRMYLAAFQ